MFAAWTETAAPAIAEQDEASCGVPNPGRDQRRYGLDRVPDCEIRRPPNQVDRDEGEDHEKARGSGAGFM